VDKSLGEGNSKSEEWWLCPTLEGKTRSIVVAWPHMLTPRKGQLTLESLPKLQWAFWRGNEHKGAWCCNKSPGIKQVIEVDQCKVLHNKEPMLQVSPERAREARAPLGYFWWPLTSLPLHFLPISMRTQLVCQNLLCRKLHTFSHHRPNVGLKAPVLQWLLSLWVHFLKIWGELSEKVIIHNPSTHSHPT
jgi:hypothetical protein